MEIEGLRVLVEPPQGRGHGAGLEQALRGNRGLMRTLRKARALLPAHGRALTRAVVVPDGRGWRLEQLVLDQPQRRLRYQLDPAGAGLVPLTRVALLPTLRVEGARLLRSDTGAPVHLKGIALFYRKDAPGAPSRMRAMVQRQCEENERLGLRSNLVRLSFFSREMDGSELEALEETAQYLQEQGIYLALTPHNVQVDSSGAYLSFHWGQKDVPVNYFLPAQEDVRALGRIAERLKGFPHVIYGLWNEPARTDWPAWGQRMIPLILAVRAHHPEEANAPLFLVPGINWSRDFRNAHIPLKPGQYLVDVHDYPHPTVWDVRAHYSHMIGKVPVLISEMGGTVFPSYRPQSPQDLAYIRSLLQEVVNAPGRQGLVHYTAWKGDDSEDGVRDPNGGLSPRGRLFHEERQHHPTQTTFR